MSFKFSYQIYNPNRIRIISKENTYHVIPFGHRCGTALALKSAGLRKFSLPFDWLIWLWPKTIQEILENDFKDFIPDVHKKSFYNKYGVTLAHFNKNIDEGINQYKRRIERFKKIIIENKKIYFVYFNEDALCNKEFRTDEKNKNIFRQMLDLEKFIKKKYSGINYTILYLNFYKHEIPKESKIINIVLKANKTFDTFDGSLCDKLRLYAGSILSKIFNTKRKKWNYGTIFNE